MGTRGLSPITQAPSAELSSTHTHAHGCMHVDVHSMCTHVPHATMCTHTCINTHTQYMLMHTHAHTRYTCKHMSRTTHEDMHVYACTYISMHKHLATQSDKMTLLSPSHPTPGKLALRNLAHKATSMSPLHLTGPGSHLWTQVRRG